MGVRVEIELPEEQIKEILKEYLMKKPQLLKEILEEIEDSLFVKHLKEAEKSPEVDKEEIKKLLEL